MKKYVAASIALLSITLAGCGSSSQSKKQARTPLSVEHLTDTGQIPQAETDDSGSFTIVGDTSSKAKLTAYLKFDSTKHPLNLDKESDGSFSKDIQMNNSTGQYTVYITAKAPNHKKSSQEFYILNQSLKFRGVSAASQSKQDKADAAKEKARKADMKATISSISANKRAYKQRQAAKKNAEYPSVSSLFGSTRLTSFSDSKLMSHGVRFTSEIIDLGADSQSQYHVLLKANGTYVLMVEDHSKTGKLAKGDTITVYGMFNGKSHVNAAQINTGIGSEYYSEPDVLFMADKVVNQDE